MDITSGRVYAAARRHTLLTYLASAGLIRVADACVSVAVVLLALDRTDRPAVAGLIITGYTLPALASGPVLGAWLDHTGHRRAALAANEAILAACMIGLVLTLGRAPLVACMGIAAVAGVTLPLTGAGFTSMVPALVSADRLARANTLDAITFNGASVVGPGVAGTLAAWFSPAVATLAVAAIAIAAIVPTLALPYPAAAPRPMSGLWSTARAGLTLLARTPKLRGGTATTAISQGAIGILAVGLPLFAMHLGATKAAGGALWGALELGAVAGAVAATWTLSRWPPERVILGGTAMFGAGMALWPLAGSIVTAGLLVAFAGLLSGPVLVATFTLRQRYAPTELLAQVSSTGASLKIGAFAIGSAAGGWLVPSVGALVALGIVAALQVVAAGVGILGGA